MSRHRALPDALLSVVVVSGLLAAACAGLGCTANPEIELGVSPRVAMEVTAARRGSEEVEVSVRLLDAAGDLIAAPRLRARVGEAARVVVGGEATRSEIANGSASPPQVELEVESWRSGTAGGGTVEVSVAAAVLLEDGRVARPVARLTVGVGPPARIVVG